MSLLCAGARCVQRRMPESLPGFVQFLDKFDTPVTRVFFDKVVDVPVVLCNGFLQVQFIDGYDAPMVMRVQRSAPHLAD